MAERTRDVDGYEFSQSMITANLECRINHKCGLRDWIFRWRRTHRYATVLDLARHFDVDPKTIYDWLRRLKIATGGVMFIDLEMEEAAGDRSPAGRRAQ